ncbi:DNA-binding protein H-NS [Erwinia persicina]|jgi:DNA-binding protein H-NS|uniref:DNA-binding protein n=2 Tax=Erwinia TaxID=551 RepID=A0ABV4EA88_9GAMM|nr:MULTISPECIES: H-NS family nucleoid-associated regulatory protein [Erwinia]MCP1437245.1 DNA-binding protein H-NS [Erwinia persicina]MDN4627193.1 H-NS family nucleoid-associated regulatory protein [Erwinia sp. PsM31]MDN8540615.1 H-NS family nucleoid-associated regulatory protein [Erwinia sp. BC051422]
MSFTLSSLKNIRSLRAQARNMATEDLEEILSKLKIIVNERREAASAQAAEAREKAEKLAMYRELMLEDGILPTELVNNLPPVARAKKKRAPRPAKYKYLDGNNEVRYWTGQGRTPTPVKNAIANGQSLHDFLI